MNTSPPVYLDYAATTPADDRVIEEMLRYLPMDGDFGNPSSDHCFGRNAGDAVRQARSVIARAIHCQGKEILFTSGATESNNMAIKGMAFGSGEKGHHIITPATEHKSVLDTCHSLEMNGFGVTYLRPDAGGLVSPEKLAAALRPGTILVSIMLVNNETGVIQDVKNLSAVARENGAVFHVDAAQGLGKLPIDVVAQGIDLMSFTAHKIYGPKGIGGLFVSEAVRDRLHPLLHGGGQEAGLRPGTLATHQIAGLAKAVELAVAEMDCAREKMERFRSQFLDALQGTTDLHINGRQGSCLPNILNISLAGVSSSTLIARISDEVAVSAGSACISGSPEPSYVLRAMSVDKKWLLNPIRISFGRFTSEADIHRAAERIREEIAAGNI